MKIGHFQGGHELEPGRIRVVTGLLASTLLIARAAPGPTNDPQELGSGPSPSHFALPLERSRFSMGTIAMVRIEALGSPPRRDGDGEEPDLADRSGHDRTDEAGRAANLAELALDAIDEVDRAASLYKPESDLNRINALASREAVRAGPVVVELLEESLRFARLTRGAFDPSIKPLMDHLGFYRELGSKPDPGGLVSALRRVGWKKIDFDRRTGMVHYRGPDMAIDFGGIGKGYALDRAAESMRRGGVVQARVELGRSHLFLGRGPDDAGLFRLDVAAPDQTGDERVRAVIHVPAGSVATSSPLAQTREVDGRLVGHIVDPRHGPLDSPVLSATVWAPTGSQADVLAKALVVSGPRALKSLARRLRFEALLFVATPPARPGRSKEDDMLPDPTLGGSQGDREGAMGAPRSPYRVIATPGLVWEEVDTAGGG